MALDFEPNDMAEVATESERVNAEPGQAGGGFMDKVVKLPEKDGYVQMRILPRKRGQKLYCATRLHYLDNPATGKKKSLHCPKELVMGDRGPKWQGQCIICKYYNDLWQKSEKTSGKEQEDLQQKARALKPVERYYYNVIVRQEKDKNNVVHNNVGPKIFGCGKTVHGKIMRAIVGDRSAGEKPLGDVTNPTNGRDFRLVKKVVKSGSNEYPNYDNSKFDEVTPLGEMDEMEGWIANLNDLSALRSLEDEESLKHSLKVHLGIIRDESSSEDELAEFHGAGTTSPKVAEESVREELTKPRAEAQKEESEVLADDDFLKELDNL